MKIQIKKIILYIEIIAVMFVSANPLFRMLRYQESTISLFLITAVFLLFHKSLFLLKKNVMVSFLVILISLLLTVLINQVPISTYIGILLQFSVAVIFTMSFKVLDFENAFVKIMIVTSAISLVFFFIGEISPSIINHLPHEQGSFLDYYHFNYLYIYLVTQGNYIIPRNSGFCWEPGCYQLFINLALLFFLLLEKRKVSQFKGIRSSLFIVLFVATVITTKSTTGIVLCIFILLANAKTVMSIFRDQHDRLRILPILILICYMIYVALNVSNRKIILESLSKINSSSYMEGKGLVERLSLNKLNYLFYNGKINIFGISFETLYKIPNNNIWNSVIENTIALGWFFSAIVINGLFRFSKVINQSLTLFLVILISLFAEALMHSSFILILVVYGIKGIENEKRES